MASDSELKERMLLKLEADGMIEAMTIAELQEKFGESSAKRGEFRRALGSLQYHHRRIRVFRPHTIRSHYGPRAYQVILVEHLARYGALASSASE